MHGNLVVYFFLSGLVHMVLPNLRNGVEWRHLNCTGIDAMIAGMFQKQACIVLPVNYLTSYVLLGMSMYS